MQNETKKFIEKAASSKEPSLMVAQGEEELEILESEVLKQGFQKAQDVREIFNAVKNDSKVFFILKNGLGNNIYNILTQYPTGQVTAYDGEKNMVANPSYKTGAILMLTTEENLKNIENSEKSLLKVAGLVWRKSI
jgi:hypothetical protein